MKEVFNTTVTGNSFGTLTMKFDTSGAVESNTVDTTASIAEVSNFSITKNIGAGPLCGNSIWRLVV
jgi:hypothetical protein